MTIKEKMDLILAIFADLDVHPTLLWRPYKRITKSMTAAALLAQLTYWYVKMDRVFYKTDKDIMSELELTKKELANAKKRLQDLELITVSHGDAEGKAKVCFYNVNLERLEELLMQSFELPQRGNSYSPKGGIAAVATPPKGVTITENTITENTTESISAPIVAHDIEDSQEGGTTVTPKSKKKKESPPDSGAPPLYNMKALCTEFDKFRSEVLGISGIYWHGKETKQLKSLMEALSKKETSGDFPHKRQVEFLKRFMQIASKDQFLLDRFTPSMLNSQFNNIMTKAELAKKEKQPEPEPEPLYHKRFDTSLLLTNIAQKKSA